MKAVVLTKPCEAKEMVIKEVPIPKTHSGWVLIKVLAFGINHSEVLLRKFEIGQSYITKPIIPGIECIGEIADPSDSTFKKGERVMALMGGMGRTFNGSYAEYTLVPTDHVFTVKSTFNNNELAAIPETFFTAFGSLHISLQLSPGESLLIRGGTSTVGLAALQLAKSMGAKVIATTRNIDRAKMLQELGADDVVLEGDAFLSRFLKRYPAGVEKVLELIGPLTLRESLRTVSYHGIICQTGLLGGKYTINNFDPIKEIPSGVYLTGFYSNRPKQSDISYMMKLIEESALHPIISRRFNFEDISEAHLMAEERKQIGKIIVTL